MDKLKYIKLENEDGSYSNSIPLAVDSDHVNIGEDILTNVIKKKADILQVSNLSNEISVQKSRIDGLSHLDEGSTTGDAELIDIRIGYDGTNYNNAGDAVRQQLLESNEKINGVLNTRRFGSSDTPSSFLLRPGICTTSGTHWDGEQYWYSVYSAAVFKNDAVAMKIECPGYYIRAVVADYTDISAPVNSRLYDYKENVQTVFFHEGATSVRIGIRKDPEDRTQLTDAEKEDIENKFKIYTNLPNIDTTLSREGFFADSKAVGQAIEDKANEISEYSLYTNEIEIEFVNGNMKTNGEHSVNSDVSEKRIRSRYSPSFGAHFLKAGTKIIPNLGYKCCICLYSMYNSAYDFQLLEYVPMRTTSYTLEQDCYVRIGLGKVNDDILWTKSENDEIIFTEAGVDAKFHGLTVQSEYTVKDKIEELENSNDNNRKKTDIILELPIEVTTDSNVEEFHSLFDEWVENGIIERELLGNVSSENLPIYLYTLKNHYDYINPNYNIVHYDGTNPLYERKKVFLSSGVHGNERVTPYALYHFIKLLLTSEQYANIKNEYDFYFIPIVNPYGFNHDQRRNEDNIDINRDLTQQVSREAQLITSTIARHNYKFFIDSHQAPSVNSPICAFLSISYYADQNKKDFIYEKWMEVGSPIQTAFATRYGKDIYKQTIFPWDGTNLDTFRNYGAQYAEYAMCYESSRHCNFYSGTTSLYNKIDLDLTTTTYCLFVKKLCENFLKKPE